MIRAGSVDDLHVGKWSVHLVRTGDTYGRTGSLTHDDPTPLVEFYDTTDGQMVTRYYADTLLDVTGGLSLNGGVPEWTVSAEDMRVVVDWLKRETS